MNLVCTPVAFSDTLNMVEAPYRIPIPHTQDEMRDSEWVAWLRSNDRFQYSYSPSQRFTARKTIAGYWVAHRVLNRRYRSDMLGTCFELNARILELAAINISLPDSEYWVDQATHEWSKYFIVSRDVTEGTQQLIEEYLRVIHGLNSIPPTEQWDSLRKFNRWVQCFSNS